MTISLIGPGTEGLRKDQKPWATPENSYTVMTNAYQFRGRILKRSGYTLLGQLANGTPVMGLRTQQNLGLDIDSLIAFDTTQAYNFNGTVFTNLASVMPVTWSGTNSQFFYSINYAGAFWATNSKPGLHSFVINPAASFSGAAGTGLTATVTVASTGNTLVVGDFVYFLNVTGSAAANNLAYAVVTAVGVGTVTVTSLNPDVAFTFVNGTTPTGVIVTSSQSIAGEDGIRYYGSLENGQGWANYNPPVDPNNALAGCLMMFAYRGYLVFLSTTEGSSIATLKDYTNRARWTQIGTPYYSSPVPNFPALQGVDPETARDDLFGRGGANDAPTTEKIVTAGFVKDILIVYFEKSTWRLRFVNNAQNPFVWERINTELGAKSTFSNIIFDKGMMAIGDRGIVLSDGNDTMRIDEKIPEDFFDIRIANQGFARVQGIRTFRSKLNYWTFPSTENESGIFPDKVLVFNYDTKNWSYFDDCFTCFGYYYPSGTPYTWETLINAWSSYTDVSWDSGIIQAGYENIVAGNQQGYVFVLEQTNGENSPSLTISNIASSILSSTDNNLNDKSWITLSGLVGVTSSDGVSLNERNFQLNNPTQSANDFSISEFKSIDAPNASGSSFSYDIDYIGIFPGSLQVNIGAIVLYDNNLDGILNGAGASGTINYSNGRIAISFDAPIASTPVYIRVVTQDPLQGIQPVEIIGTYTPNSGQITKISGIDIQSKIFNFLPNDQSVRISKIDFYTNVTENGQFTCNIFGDSSNYAINAPLSDNLLSNIVLTSNNPYQISQGDQTIYRLFCDAVAQTVQTQITFSDQQMAVNAITQSDIEILAMIFTIRNGGRLI